MYLVDLTDRLAPDPSVCGRIRSSTIFVLFLLVLWWIIGCAQHTTIDQKIYRVATDSGVNYYRVRIESKAMNSKVQYKTGLYPAYAVDAFNGDNNDLPREAVDSESRLREMLANAQQNVYQSYLQETNDEKRAALLTHLIDLQRLPLIDESQPLSSTNGVLFYPMEFNPLKNLVDHHLC